MTYAELEAKVTEVLKTPDSALVTIKPILEEIKVDYEAMAGLMEANSKQEARIRDLQDTNMKLFLAQTGQVEKQEEEEDDGLSGADAIDAFFAKMDKEEEN